MRIAHVLTYVSGDGAYGGPLAVMVAQTAELAALGHEVEIFAGWDGEADLDVEGVAVRLFRARRLLPTGFSGLVAPSLAVELYRRRHHFDVVHLHLSRDLITTTAAVAVTLGRSRPRLFVQTHGMIKPDARPLARILDVVLRRVLRRSSGAFALNAVDAQRISEVARGTVTVLDLPNGVPTRAVAAPPEPTTLPEFLFLARLQPRKRVLLFAEAVRLVCERGVAARFSVVGPDEGDLGPLLAYIDRHGLQSALTYEGSVPPGRGPDRLGDADVYVLPSLDEPFPMTVLEAMSVGRPCIVSASCHIADSLVRGGGVRVFDGSASGLADVIELLVRDPRLRVELGRRAAEDVRARYSSAAVAQQLLGAYDAVTPTVRDAVPARRTSGG